MGATLTSASPVRIISTSHYVEGNAILFDHSGTRMYQQYQQLNELHADQGIELSSDVFAWSSSQDLTASITRIGAYGKYGAGMNQAYAYASAECVFRPLESAISIELSHRVLSRLWEKPTGVWAMLIDTKENRVIDSVWWREQDEAENGEGWEGMYALAPGRDYKLTLDAAADALNDGGWEAMISAQLAPEPPTVLFAAAGLLILRGPRALRNNTIRLEENL
jgi:hypothetical protein